MGGSYMDRTHGCDEQSKRQLSNIAQRPFINHHIAPMPDVYVGMIAIRLSLTADDLDEKPLQTVYNQINRYVPVGRNQHQIFCAETKC